jgi:[histone H3]-lysine36 N-trimethyltransferase
MNKYKSKLPRDDLKRFAKEVSSVLFLTAEAVTDISIQIADKLVNSDFKSGRVDDPTKIDEKHEKKVKKYCKEFFDKAAYKHRKLEKERATRKQKSEESKSNDAAAADATSPVLNLDASPDMKREGNSEDDDVKMSEDEEEKPTPPSPSIGTNGDGLKRKREEDDEEDLKAEIDITKSPAKRMKSESPPPPPPPPGPPVDTPPMQSEDASPTETDEHLHADTSFAEKSMADVLAQAQQDSCDGDDGADVSMQDANHNFANGVKDAKDSLHFSDVVEHGLRSPSEQQNGHSPRLKAKPREIKAES